MHFLVLLLAGTAHDQQDFKTLQTEHWEIVYSTTEKEATEAGIALERTWVVYNDVLDRLGYKAKKLSGKMSCIFYKDRAHYEEQMKAEGKSASVPGYGAFSSSANRLTLIMTHITQAQGMPASINSLAVHEAVHQLANNIGPIDSPSSPTFLKEGLAGSFETVEYMDDFGPFSKRLAPRVRATNSFVAKGEYAHFEDLIVKVQPQREFGKQMTEENIFDLRSIYNQGASVVTFMLNEHPDAFKIFLKKLKSTKNGREQKEHWRWALNEAFPDIKSLESGWKSWVLKQDRH